MDLYVQNDSSGRLRAGDWLNEGLNYERSDGKDGFYTTWSRYEVF